MNTQSLDQLLSIQQDEVESYEIYTRLATKEKIEENKKILSRIATDELAHYEMLRKITQQDIAPRKWRVWWYTFLAHSFGLTFGLKLMELGERDAEESYHTLKQEYPKLEKILQEEEQHERELIDMLSEAKLGYMGSIVLGLNDALVELTGALAGFTFAIQNSRTIALLGLITGISASFSMAASEFLSQRQEEGGNIREALISSAYTGCAYIATVICLVTPFLLTDNPFHALGYTILIALIIIALFNFYISVAKDYSFKKRFTEMAVISLSVALISFGIGWFVKTVLGLEV